MFKIAKIRASQMVPRDEIVAYKSNMKAGFLSIFDKYLFLQAERRGSARARSLGDWLHPLVGGIQSYSKWALKKATVLLYLALTGVSK